MEWEDREESQNVEDRRGFPGGTTGMVVGGVGGLVAAIVGLALAFGIDLRPFVGGGQQNPGGGQRQQPAGKQRPLDPAEEKQAHFSKVIFHDTEVIWDEQFKKMGRQYKYPKLVLYTDRVESACGQAESSVGPFYCPADRKVYIDLSFYRDMVGKLNAPGEFPRAYVIAHEVGHHVQNLLGYSAKVDRARRTMSKTDYNRMSVRLELQADYFAGVWAHYAQEKYKFLQPEDIKEALRAAFEIGDDRLQSKARGTVKPDSFTHGTSRQRVKWFKRGFDTGDVDGASQLFDLPYEDL